MAEKVIYREQLISNNIRICKKFIWRLHI